MRSLSIGSYGALPQERTQDPPDVLHARRSDESPFPRTTSSTLPVLTLAACGALLASCGGESGPDKGSESILRLNEVGNGFGQLLPHRVAELDSGGNPTGQILSIRSLEDITNNVVRGNPILPSDTFREGAIEPDGQPGNHFLYANFTQPLDPLTVLNPSPTGSPLAGAVSITTINPFNGATLSARGRAFIGGRTIAGEPVGDPPRLDLQRWVEIDPDTGFLRVADGAGQAAGPRRGQVRPERRSADLAEHRGVHRDSTTTSRRPRPSRAASRSVFA